MDKENIKTALEETLRKMGVVFEAIEVCDTDSGSCLRFVVKSPDSRILIGAQGEHLQALNHVMKRIVAKQTTASSTPAKFFIDINDYQDRMFEELKNKVKVMSERARSFQVDVELEPMSSYERMLVHSCLESAPDLKTESKGEGRERRVVIKYVKAQF